MRLAVRGGADEGGRGYREEEAMGVEAAGAIDARARAASISASIDASAVNEGRLRPERLEGSIVAMQQSTRIEKETTLLERKKKKQEQQKEAKG